MKDGRKWALGGLIAALSLYFIHLCVRLSLHKFYAIDEFQYGHAAFLVQAGQVPFRDFFDHHFPLIYQLFAPLFALEGEALDYLRWMRLAMWPFIALAAGTFFLIRRDWSAPWALLFLFSGWPLMSRMTEIRPDTLALSLTLFALAVLYTRLEPRFKGLLSGFALTLAVWSSQKVMVYGLPFVVAFLSDLFGMVRKREHFMLGRPLFFALGSIVALLTFPLMLFSQGVLADWFYWCIEWPMAHESSAAGFAWQKFFMPLLRGFWWQVPLFAMGLFTLLQTRWRERALLHHPDMLLLSIVLLSFISYTMQKAPYAYSLIPFLVLNCLVCGIGTNALGRLLGKLPYPTGLKTVVVLVPTAFLLLLVGFQARHFKQLLAQDNHYQKEMLALVARVVAPTDAVYDNSASTLNRPSVHFYYFTNAHIRKTEAKRLTKEIPEAIREQQCTYYFHDSRFRQLSRRLQQFIASHFHPYKGELWVYGKRFQPTPEPQAFEVYRAGNYFITPAEAAAHTSLNGQPLNEVTFQLEPGTHLFQQTDPKAPFHVLWLPADGNTFKPVARGNAPFSKL